MIIRQHCIQQLATGSHVRRGKTAVYYDTPYTFPLGHVRSPMTLLYRLKVANLWQEKLSHQMPRVPYQLQKWGSESFKEGFHSNGRVFFVSYILLAYKESGIQIPI